MKRLDAVRVMAADIAENNGRLSRLGLRVMVENRIAIGSKYYKRAVELGRGCQCGYLSKPAPAKCDFCKEVSSEG